jgi:hypothetical protein
VCEELPEGHFIRTANKLHKCDVCNTNFPSRKYLNSHYCVLNVKIVMDRHGICISETSLAMEKNRTCVMCYKFCVKSALMMHSSTHTGLRPHKCNECNKEFSQ